MRPKLVLVAGKADKREVRLKLPTIVGRTRDAGLMIAHKTVSRRHCELFERQGMLFVRDTGSRNGTLVDNAPIKESMVKPGHTVTIGPLTFRADYEPADAFIRSDDDDFASGTNGAADDTSLVDESAKDSKAAKAASIKQTTKPSDTPSAGELEFEELGPEDGGDIELDMPAMLDVGDEHDEGAATGAQAAVTGDALSADDSLALDDELALDFEEAVGAPAEAAGEDDLLGFDVAEAGVDTLHEIEPAEGNLSFDLTEEPAAAPPAGPAELSLDDGDLGFELEATLEPAPAEASAEGDELGFTLEDLEESPAEMAAPAAEESSEQDDALSFDLAEPEVEPEPAPAKAGAKKADSAGKVPLGEEKAAGGDSEMSRFMKELGL